MEFKKEIQESLKDYFKANFGVDIPNISISQINPDFRHLGDYAFNFNALRKIAKEHNADLKEIVLTVASTILAKQEGEAVESIRAQFAATDLDKGFINLKFSDQFWAKQLQSKIASGKVTSIAPKAGKVVLEYCGPNTNKPLHIGHLRNMMLGFSMSEVLKADGYDVTKVNIYNDRGIAICKSIAAYLHAGNGATPQSTGIKGDHFVGDYYVEFGKIVDAQLREKYALGAEVESVAKHLGKEREVIEQETPIFDVAKDLLLKWEAGDAETIALWQKMNSWVYEGFNETFNTLGVDFEKDYFESDTYKLGKEIIELGLQKNVFKRRADGAVIIDLTPDG